MTRLTFINLYDPRQYDWESVWHQDVTLGEMYNASNEDLR